MRHASAFIPSISLFGTCESETELRRLADALLEGGQALMPPDDYGFSKLFVWLIDWFGISAQLNLPLGLEQRMRTRSGPNALDGSMVSASRA